MKWRQRFYGDHMEDLFELMITANKEKGESMEACIGIRLKVAGHETICPITKRCTAYEKLELELGGIRKNLESLLNRAKETFQRSEKQADLGLDPSMPPQEIWPLLSGLADEKAFVDAFNSLEEEKRREVAEHVLTQCNIFSGKAAVFSARYDEKTAQMT
jgi:hypothetical protein